jgi:hypothetical protein
MSRNGSRSHTTAALAKTIAYLGIKYDIELWWRWRPRENPLLDLADAISKSSNHHHWRLSADTCLNVIQAAEWPSPTADGYILDQTLAPIKYTLRNGQLFRLTRFLDSSTTPTTPSQAETIIFNFPSEQRTIINAIKFLVDSPTRAIIFLPLWERSSFWEIIQHYASAIIRIPYDPDILQKPLHSSSTEYIPRWDHAAALLHDDDTSLRLPDSGTWRHGKLSWSPTRRADTKRSGQTSRPGKATETPSIHRTHDSGKGHSRAHDSLSSHLSLRHDLPRCGQPASRGSLGQ